MHNIAKLIYTTLWSSYSHEILVLFIVGLTLISIPLVKKYGAPGIKLVTHIPGFETRQLLLAVFWVAFGIYLSLIPAWEEFTYWDSDIYFSTLKDGYQWYPPPIWPFAGRLFPLAHQEFTYLSLLYPNAFFYHVFTAIQLVAVILVSGILVDAKLRIWVLSAILTTPAIAQSYFCLIYPERNMVLLLAISIAGAIAWSKRNNIIGFIAASFCGTALLFYKEIAFLLTGSIAILGIYCYWRGDKSPSNRNIFVLAAVYGVGVICWLGVYLLAIFPEIIDPYRPLHPSTHLDSISHLAKQPWFFALLIVLSVRTIALWRARIAFDPLWDGIALGAILYTTAMVVFSFDLPYYFTPPAFITWILLGRLMVAWTSEKGIAFFWVAYTILAAFILLQGSQTMGLIKQKKEFVASKADAAKFIHEITSGSEKVRIHYPTANSYEACLFSGFIDAKYRINVTTILPEHRGEQGPKICFPGNKVSYTFGLPIEAGDIMVSFGVPPATPPAPTTVFVSESIGFWKNMYRTYVYRFPTTP